ncbi:MAG: response regulator transcription factor [Lewinellaceae bacterium]|nr:response regulator transcription factor [Lewinellaceae bacterium]
MVQSCLIIEDEPLAAEILAEYIGMTSFLRLSGICNDALQALEWLKQEQVDVIFLDINLPKISGLAFIKTLRNPPQIIITSAHHEYAVEGFDLRVVDYLLKPIEFGRFTKAVNKLGKMPTGKSHPTAQDTRPFYFFTVNKRSVKIYLDEILFIESLKDSVSIHTPHTSYHTHYQLGELESMMRNDNFLRIHRSFMVAIDKIESFSAAELEINGRVLPIGRSHKPLVMERLGRT